MTEIRLTSQLGEQGYTSTEIRRLARDGHLVRVRRGAYLEGWAKQGGVRTEHRRLVLATVAQAGSESAVSHHSAAVLHGLPLWPDHLGQVHVTRDRSGHSKRQPHLHVHGLPLPESDVVLLDGVRVTSLARTVLDVACSMALHEAVAIGDAALRAGLAREELETLLDRHRRRHGIQSARRAVALMDDRSESPGESVSRVRFHEWGLPAPEPQHRVLDAGGRLLARVDFAWPDLGIVGEFDGREKYGRLLKPGQTGLSAEDVVYSEKRREDALRDLGWWVVRWVWSDLFRPDVLRPRIERALARAGWRG